MVASFVIALSMAAAPAADRPRRVSRRANPATLVARANRRFAKQGWSLPPQPSGPRIAADPEAAPGIKEQAVAEDGQRCAVVGGRLCTNPPRTLVTTDF